MAKLQEGYRVFEYNGKRYGVPKDMPNDEAEQLIKEQFDVKESEVLEQFARDTTPQTRVSPERTVDLEPNLKVFHKKLQRVFLRVPSKLGRELVNCLRCRRTIFLKLTTLTESKKKAKLCKSVLVLIP